MGSTVPLARTAAERAAKGDPRLSLAERVHHEHVEITPAHERLADHLGPAQHAHGGVVGQREAQLAGRAVGVEQVGRAMGLVDELPPSGP